MLCPECKSINVYCVDSRPRDKLTWRRRSCADCGTRFNTIEISQVDYKQIKDKALAYDFTKKDPV